MPLYGLIGYPLSHSFSKKYFTEKFEREELHTHTYELFPIASIDGLKEVLQNHPDLVGLNVTIPYKQDVLSFLDEQDEVVKNIGACNCIRVNNGKLKGFNTDVIGFEKSLKVQLQPSHKKALILGTGGAAKAVEYVLAKLRIAFKYVSRKPVAGQLTYEEVTDSLLHEYTLIVNTTPLGMYPAVDQAPPLPYEALTAQHYLFDLVYNPSRTLFLQKGEAKGAAVENGYAMLLIQADESWVIWNQ